MLKYFPTPTGLFANLHGELGCIDATIHRPTERKLWRVCYATCTGVAKHLQGKVIDVPLLRDAKAILTELDQHLNPAA